jgi:hypothetical protein
VHRGPTCSYLGQSRSILTHFIDRSVSLAASFLLILSSCPAPPAFIMKPHRSTRNSWSVTTLEPSSWTTGFSCSVAEALDAPSSPTVAWSSRTSAILGSSRGGVARTYQARDQPPHGHASNIGHMESGCVHKAIQGSRPFGDTEWRTVDSYIQPTG